MSDTSNDIWEHGVFVKLIGNKNIIKIVDFLAGNSPGSYSKSEICTFLGMGRSNVYKVWPLLEEFNIIKSTRSCGRFRFYTLNKDSPIVRNLIKLKILTEVQ